MSNKVREWWIQWEQYKKDQIQIKAYQEDFAKLVEALEEIASGENDFGACAEIAREALDVVVLKNPKE